MNFFQDLLTKEDIVVEDSLLASIPNLVTDEGNAFLLSPFMDEEIEKAIFYLGGDRAPGPDGFPAAFFQKYWHIVGNDIVEALREFQRTKHMPVAVNATFLTLIPKVVGALSFSQYRPISLCNSVLKIITKTLANRLKSLLPSLITPHQGGFVKGRLIFDGVISLHEIIHSMDKSKEAGMILKLDMNKAYDRVSWSFLERVLLKFEFNKDWVSLTMKCVSTTWFSVLINGAVVSFFKSSRGLK